MAGLILFANSGEVVLVAATAKTCLQVKSPANQGIVIRALRFLGKMPAGGTDTPMKVRLTFSTTNFGTFTGMTPGKQNPSRPETKQGVYGQNATVEPTTPTDSGLWWEVQPQSGIEELLPIDQWIDVPGGYAANFECTSPGTPTFVITATCEE